MVSIAQKVCERVCVCEQWGRGGISKFPRRWREIRRALLRQVQWKKINKTWKLFFWNLPFLIQKSSPTPTVHRLRSRQRQVSRQQDVGLSATECPMETSTTNTTVYPPTLTERFIYGWCSLAERLSLNLLYQYWSLSQHTRRGYTEEGNISEGNVHRFSVSERKADINLFFNRIHGWRLHLLLESLCFCLFFCFCSPIGLFSKWWCIYFWG